MEIATMTFHGAYNYGSMLQAYALQKTLQKLGADTEIINFRTDRQKALYRVISKRKSLVAFVKDLSHLIYYRDLKVKNQKFENFIATYCKLSQDEYNSLNELEKAILSYDVTICGSDQIWNPAPIDFDEAYLLPFSCGKKVSYAASVGPIGKIPDDYRDKYKSYLDKFSAISVREEKSASVIASIVGDDKDIRVVCDPVFLLKKEEWVSLIPQESIISGDYILFYTLFANKQMVRTVKGVSKEMGLPVVISNYSNIYDLFSPFSKRLDCGPIDFLNLIQHAKLICTSSFHGTAFCAILNKPCITIGGSHDNRRQTLLEKLQLRERFSQSAIGNQGEDWTLTNELISKYREEGLGYLREIIR